MAQIKLAEYTFDNSVGDCLPTLTPNTITMTTEDSVNGTTTKRIIYIDNTTLPTRIRFGTDEKSDKSLLTVDHLDIDTNITSMEKMFYGCSNLTYVNATNWNTTNVTNMYYAFGITNISEINMTSFNTDKVTNMDYMFGNCASLKFIDITNFTTRSNMSTGSMFSNNKIKVIYDGNKWKSFMSSGITSVKVTPPEHIIAKYKYDTSITSSVTQPTITGISSSSIVTKEVTTGVDNINYVIIGYDGTEQPITKISFSGFESLLTIEYLNLDSNINEASRMFYNCTNLTSINTYGWNTATVTDMSYMFNDCSSLTSLDLSSFDTTSTTNMISMFYGCIGITTLNLTNFDTTSVTSSSYMFGEWTSSQTVYIGKKWTIDTSSYSANFIREVVYEYMIAKYTFDNSVADCLPTITGATTSQWGYSDKVDGTTTTRTIGTDEELTITNISFRNKTSLLTLDYLNFTNAITNATRMFNGCTALTSINALNWDTSNVTNMNAMFNSCRSLASLDASNWDVGKVTNMSDMFYACTAFTTLDLSVWNVSKVTNMSTMFSTCNGLTTLNVSGWDTSSVKSMNSTFTGCSKLTTLDLSSWKVDGVTSMSGMFNACSQLTTLNISTWNTSAVSNMGSMFQGCGKLTTLDLSHFNVENVTSTTAMFNACSQLTTLNLSNWNVGKLTNTSMMFRNCPKLNNLDLSQWKTTDALTNMSSMFYGCKVLTSVDLSNFNTSNVTSMSELFFDCGNLTMVDISNFDTSKVTIWGHFSANKLTNIGLVYASSSTINSIVTKWFGTSVARNVYYMDAEPSELTTQTNITYVPYSQSILSCNEEITLRSNGDVYDELDLLTGQVIQRIGEDNEILEEEIIRTVELDGEINFYENSYIHTSSNEIIPEFEFQPTLTNCYAVSDLKPNTQYTVLFEGNPTLMSLGGTTIENPISKIMITSGEVDNILWFDTSVSKIMILEGDLTDRDVEYFTGVKSSQKIQVQLRGEKYVFPISMQLPPHIELRSLIDGSVRDEVDLSTGILIRRVGLDANGYPYALEEPIEEQLILNHKNTCDYGRILPTGVQDRYNVVTNEYYQTMETIVLDGKNVWLEMEDLGNVLKFTATGETVEIEDLNMLGTGGLYCDNNLFPNINDDSDVEHCRVDEEGNKFYIYISKERLMSPDLIGYQIWLQQNNFNMTYELAVPQNIIKPYEELDPTQARWDTLDSIRDSMIYLMSTDKDDDYIITPTFEYITPSSNNFYLDLLLPNTEYTVYAEGINEEVDTINLGGVTTPYTRACLMTSGDNKWVTFDNNETFDKVMIIRGNSQNEFIGYFKGIGNIDNPTITIVNEDESQQSQVSYPDVHLRSLPTGERDYFDAVLGTVTQNVGVRPFEDGDLENMDLITDGINTLYPLTEPITQYVTPKPLLAYDNGKIKITSDTGLVTTLTYAVPFSNTYRLPHLKTGTLYTIKYPSASGTITIGDITYRITSDSMLFTTPLVINGDTSAIIFSDENPQNVILLEGGYSNREVDYFAGIKSVSNPIITITDNTVESPENVEYKPVSEIELRSLPNGIADVLDIVKQKVTISVGYRHYQEGDEYLDNVWTDGYNTAYALENPIVRDIQFVTPIISTNSIMKLSSNGLIPQLNYRVPSTNNFPLDLLLPNTTYTLYGQTNTPITYSLGGVYNSTLIGAEVISLGSINNNLLTFNGDVSSANIMLIKGDTTGISVPYFQGVKSVNNIDFIIEGLQGERNTMSLQSNVSLRACGNIKDSIDMTTCILTKELGEVVLRGNEAWFSLEEVESINVDYVLFGCIVGGAANSQSTSVICNRFNHKYLSGSLHQQECVYCTDNQVRICIKKTTIGGNNITALKTWLEQNNVSVIYALRTPLSEKLTSVWETMPPTSYDNQTVITTQPHSNTPKPIITITVATTTLEDIISTLETQNAKLEEENIATMLALTGIYETMVVPIVDSGISTINLSDGKDGNNMNGMSISPMGMIYAKLVKKGLKTIEQVPAHLQAEVKYVLKEDK